MNVTDCPHPKKRRYPTKEAAEARASIQSIQTYPYLCQCGEWHLTMKRTAASVPEDPAAQRAKELADLPDDDFALVVAAELRGRADAVIAAALRHWTLWGRWERALRAESTSLHRQLAARKHSRTEPTQQWRARVVARQGAIHSRILELRSFREQRRLEQAARRSTPEARMRREAATEAKARLMRAHWEEYRTYMLEELQFRGLDWEDHGAEAPPPERP